MQRAGIKLNTNQKKELEDLIVEMGNAMRRAHYRYVAESGRLTPKIVWILERYKWWTMKLTDTRRVK